MIVGLIGTTITPWMQFYLQASIVEKGVDQRHYSLSRWDVILGCIVTDVIAFFIVVACAATIYKCGHGEITDVGEAALALRPLCRAIRDVAVRHWTDSMRRCFRRGDSCRWPPRTTVCEGLGFESGVEKRFSEAPIFYWLYTLLIRRWLRFVLIPNAPLIKVTILSQVLNGVLLPVVIILMLVLINRKDLMGDHKNSRLWNVIAWGTSVIVIGMTFVMLWGMIPGH